MHSIISFVPTMAREAAHFAAKCNEASENGGYLGKYRCYYLNNSNA